MKRGFMITFVLILSSILITGCIEQEQEYTINPDGSGKVKLHAVFSNTGMGSLMGENQDPEAQAEQALRDILFNSKGVDTWKDVEFELNDDGKYDFNGTAYFKDFNDLELKIQGFDKLSVLEMDKDSKGRISIEVKEDEDEDDSGEESVPVDLTEKELDRKVREAKNKFQKQKAIVGTIMSDMKIDYVFHLPGRISKSTNFKKIDSKTVRVTFSGKAILELMEKLMNDDEWLRETIAAGKDPMKDGPEGEELNELMFGEKAPVKVTTVSNLNPIFDYEKEVTAAKAKYKTMVKELGLNPETHQKIRTSKKLESGKLIIGGVRMINVDEEKYGIRPFHHNKGYTISAVMPLPENTIEVTGGKISKALTDDGKSILPKRSLDRSINFARISDDKGAADFEIKLQTPGENARGIKKLKGILKCISSTGTKEINLGMMDFVKGAKSEESGISISKVEKSKWDEKYRIELKVDFVKGGFKEGRFFDENGKRLECKRSGFMSTNDRMKMVGFKFEEKPPAKGKIVLEVYDDITEHEMKFELSNVDLLGKPWNSIQ